MAFPISNVNKNVETKRSSLNNYIKELRNFNIIANMNIEPNANPSENYAIFGMPVSNKCFSC